MYKEDLALNNLQWLICHKNPNKPLRIYLIYMYNEDLNRKAKTHFKKVHTFLI